MGNICSSCFKSTKEEDDAERARLLQDPVADTRSSLNGTTVTANDPYTFSGGDGNTSGFSGFYQNRDTSYGSVTDGPANGNKSETSAWNRTLDNMANKVIDVSTLDSFSNALEQNEVIEKQNVYARKVQQQQSKIQAILKNTRGVRTSPKVGLTSPSNVSHLTSEAINRLKSAADPIDQDDLALIREFSEKSIQAFKTGFVVNVKEDLVVQFDP